MAVLTGPGARLRAVVLILVAATATATALHSSAPATQASASRAPARPHEAAIVAARLVCPRVVTRTVGSVSIRTWVGVATPVSGSVSGTGQAREGLLGPKPHTSVLLVGPGRAVLRLAHRNRGAVDVDATGAVAAGLAADQLTRRDNGAYRGLDSVSCTPPAGQAWAVGAATTVGVHSVLTLANVDSVPAVVDVLLNGRHGPVDAPSGRGIVVAPHRSVEVQLDQLAPAEPLLLVHIAVRAGRVAAALLRQDQHAATAKGVDYLPLVDAPTTRAVVPGVFGNGGPRTLFLANPGGTDTTAAVQLAADSLFVPKGLAHVSVPAGEVIAVDLTKALAGKPATVVVSTDRPVIVGAAMSTGPRVNGIAETAYSAAVPALSGPALVSANDVRFHESYLFLGAPNGPATVRVSSVPGVGVPGRRSKTVVVGAGRTVVVNLASLAGSSTYVAVAVTPIRGAVYAAREVFEQGARGPLFTLLPLRTAPRTVRVPVAVNDIEAGLPRSAS